MDPSQFQSGIPAYFHWLSQEDQEKYYELQKKIKQQKTYCCVDRSNAFFSILVEIYKFAVRLDAYDDDRCCVCGVFWSGNKIAINLKQMAFLFGDKRVSLSACCEKNLIGLENEDTELKTALMERTQLFSKNPQMLKQWTFHKTKLVIKRNFYNVDYGVQPPSTSKELCQYKKFPSFFPDQQSSEIVSYEIYIYRTDDDDDDPFSLFPMDLLCIDND